ncbi:MAG TPA: WD40 repeat domain-containing protein, partial [Terriglobales bacterium]|nr:WD40 repeat domain-containing protein [Terriglobales bacterium]
HFTPDSTQVVLHNDNLRVEGWSIADQKRVFVKEVVVPKGCMQSTLSPDGKVLACFGENFELLLLDVASGTEIYRKESFYSPESVTELINWMVARLLSTDGYQFISLEFSPDSKFFIGAKSTTSLAFDFETKKPIKMKGMMSEAIRGDFAFLAPDRVIGLNVFNTAKSWVVRFPTGEKLQELALGISKLSAPAKGNYVMMRPVKKFAVGVVDIAQNKGVIANKLGAFDIYENVYATQRRDGELAIYPLQAGQAALAAIPLPKSPLSRIRALALSPNLDFLAVSERNRGAVWDLSNSKRLMHVRGFRGAYLDDAKRLYADFPKQDEGARVIAKFEVMTNFSYDSIPLGDNRASQNGPFLVLTKPKKKDETSSNATLEIQDVRTSLVLWKRDFPKEVPEHEINPRLGTMVLRWKMTESAAKQEIKSDPALASKVSAMGDKEGDYLMIVVDAKTGKNIGKVLIETGKGSFHIHSMMAAGDTLIVTDSNNRVLVYSIKEGKQLARTFGDSPSISPDGRLLAIQNEVGVISIFEAGTLKKHHELHFADDVALTDFSEDGKRLFILTRDQTVYLIDLDKQKELLAKN